MTKPSIVVQDVALRFPKQRGLIRLVLGLFRKQKPIEFVALKSISLEVQKVRLSYHRTKRLREIHASSCDCRHLSSRSVKYKPLATYRFLQGLAQGSQHQTGRENALYGSILGHSEREMDEKIEEIVRLVSLVHLLMNH